MTDIRNIFSLVSTLSGVKRFSLLKMVHPENVLEHTGMIVIFAYTIAAQINQRNAQSFLDRKNSNLYATEVYNGEEIDIGAVLEKATVHDWDEVATGDVVRPTKYHSETLREGFRDLEVHGIAKIAAKLSLPRLIEAHANSKDLSDPAGYIVAFADLMCAVHRAWEEVLIYGNGHLVPSAAGMHGFLRKLHANRPTANKEFHRVLDEYENEMNIVLGKITSAGYGEFKEMI